MGYFKGRRGLTAANINEEPLGWERGKRKNIGVAGGGWSVHHVPLSEAESNGCHRDSLRLAEAGLRGSTDKGRCRKGHIERNG